VATGGPTTPQFSSHFHVVLQTTSKMGFLWTSFVLATLLTVSKSASPNHLEGPYNFSYNEQTSKILASQSECEHLDHAHSLSKKDLQKLMEKFIAKVSLVIKNFDPLSVAESNFDVDAYGIICKGFFKDYSLEGTSDFSVDKLIADNSDDKIVKFEIALGFNNIRMSGAYDLDLSTLSLLEIFGNGAFGWLLNGFNVSIAMDLVDCKNQTLQVKGLDFDFTVDKVEIDFKNLLNNPPLSVFINKIVTDTLADVLMSFRSGISLMTGLILKDVLNAQLIQHQITLDYIIDFIEHFVQ